MRRTKKAWKLIGKIACVVIALCAGCVRSATAQQSVQQVPPQQVEPSSAQAKEATPAESTEEALANAAPMTVFAPQGDESTAYALEKVADGLDNPCGLAVMPGSFVGGASELFFSESGAGRVRRFNTRDPRQIKNVVDGFPVSAYGSGPVFRIGPLGLAFIAAKKLAVGGGGGDDGQEVISVFRLPDDGAELSYEQQDHSAGPVAAGARSKGGEGNFFGLARTETALMAAANGDDGEGWILKANIDANRLVGLQPFVASGKLTGVSGPTALTVNAKPGYGYLVGANMGPPGKERDSVLAFYSPTTGRIALVLPLGLFDVVSLAYSPSGNLYAADFSWEHPEAGGVYRIDQALIDKRQACRAVKIASLVRPTSITFTEDGTLWATAFGDVSATPGTVPNGTLLRITGSF